jgi:hypothetical protein
VSAFPSGKRILAALRVSDRYSIDGSPSQFPDKRPQTTVSFRLGRNDVRHKTIWRCQLDKTGIKFIRAVANITQGASNAMDGAACRFQ